MFLIQTTTWAEFFPLRVFMSELHGLHSTVDALEMFLVPPLSSQCLQGHWKEGAESQAVKKEKKCRQSWEF